jgi:protein-S-isoprenylcysteine O-methyltransferase Ste14
MRYGCTKARRGILEDLAFFLYRGLTIAPIVCNTRLSKPRVERVCVWEESGETSNSFVESEISCFALASILAFRIPFYNCKTALRRHHRAAVSFEMDRPVLNLGAQILPVLLMILAGWGFDDVPHFFSNPARAGIAGVTLVAAFVAVIWKLDSYPLRRGTTPVRNQGAQLGVLLLLSLALLWFLPLADRRKILTLQHDYWRYFGVLLFSIGVAVRLLALKALGKYFSAYVTLQPNHRLVQHGVYASIRHPLYLSLLLIPTGVALVFASSLALPIFILAAAFVFDRIRKEERLLAVHFVSQFEDYRRRTRKLIPLLF